MTPEVESALSLTSRDLAPPIQIALLLGAMSLLSAAFVTLTAFTRIAIVLSFVRRALSTQEIPPNQVMLGLALFMTLFVMAPTFQELQLQAVQPYLNGEVTSIEAWTTAARIQSHFMLQHTREADLQLFLDLGEYPDPVEPAATPLLALIPAFIISELRTAFLMGFCLFLPFVVIDLVVSMILMALGMMMMPPVVISTPCKLLLFVMIDGWHLLARALCLSFRVVA
jgi:flagellar biosynthetic protein FliP